MADLPVDGPCMARFEKPPSSLSCGLVSSRLLSGYNSGVVVVAIGFDLPC